VDSIVAEAASPRCSISVEAPALVEEPDSLRREDGASVFTEHTAGRYTSQSVLDAEQRLLNAARTPVSAGLAGQAVSAAIDGYEGRTGRALDAGQRQLTTTFASRGTLLAVGLGAAGSGKTTAMRALAFVLRQGGTRLVPLATSAAAADVLGRELGVHADNLHKFLYEHTRGRHAARLRNGGGLPAAARPYALHRGDVVVVDEAGMAGTFALDQLVSIAAHHGAVVRLLGDDRQLSAVESGGAFRLVAHETRAAELTTLYRFRDPAEAAATLKLRIGDASGLDFYLDRGRVRSGSREAMTQAAYAGWRADMLAGKTTVMTAASGTDVTALSAQARAERIEAGQVEHNGVLLRNGTMAGCGDWIVTRENNRRLAVHGGRDWVKNGDAWRVIKQYRTGALRVEHLGHRGCVTLPAEYVAGQVQLMYATTAHRAQGTTVDTAHALITAEMSREGFYVTASRARERTIFYTATHDLLPVDEDQRLDATRTDPRSYAAREVLENVLAREGAELSATESIRVAQDQAASLAVLVPRYTHASHLLADSRYQRTAQHVLGDDDGRALTLDPAWGAVVRALQAAELSGWQATQLLTEVVDLRELDTARSTAEVIAWRIDAYIANRPAPARSGELHETSFLPPWITGPAEAASRTPETDRQIAVYLDVTADAIQKRVYSLAANAIRIQPAWVQVLGRPARRHGRYEEWLRHVGVVAAYRDQYQVATDDPRQVLGPYPEPGHAGHRAYWNAAESVLGARAVAGLEDPARAPGHVRAQLAGDLYLGLPEPERAEVCAVMARHYRVLWFGAHRVADDQAATQALYASGLAQALVERGHLTQRPGRVTSPAETSGTAAPARTMPLEAALARRRKEQERRQREGARAIGRSEIVAPLQQPVPVDRRQGPLPTR
jgi:DNA transposition AAA+ family ATPase